MGQSRMRDHTGWKTINSAIPAVPEVYLSGGETLRPRPETYQNPRDGQWRIPSSHPSRRHQRRPEQERETLWFFVVCCLRTTDGSAGDFFSHETPTSGKRKGTIVTGERRGIRRQEDARRQTQGTEKIKTNKHRASREAKRKGDGWEDRKGNDKSPGSLIPIGALHRRPS